MMKALRGYNYTDRSDRKPSQTIEMLILYFFITLSFAVGVWAGAQRDRLVLSDQPPIVNPNETR